MAQRDAQVQGALVEIFGERYHIGGDPKQVQQVAAHVDARMKKIAEGQPRMPKAQVAILAAMEVSAELLKVMSERKVFTERAHESIERLSRLVEDRVHLTTRGADAPAATPDDGVGGDRLRDLPAEGARPAPRGAAADEPLARRPGVRLPHITSLE